MARNILFITADQWRADTAGFAGHPLVKTPHLDALAEDAAVFENHFTCATPCGPSRATMLTGQYPFIHRSVGNGIPLDARFTNLAREARNAGYDPVLFGYTDTSIDPRGLSPDDPLTRTYEGVLDGFRQEASHNELFMDGWPTALRARGYDVPEALMDLYLHRGTSGPMERFSTEPALFRAEDSDTAYIADRVIDHLNTREENGWFLHVSFLRPHPPLIAPEPYNTMYDPADVALPPKRDTLSAESAQHPFLAWWHDKADDHHYFESQVNTMRLTDNDVRAMRAIYYGLMTEVDHHVGRIIETVRAMGALDDTLIIVTSDHGEELGSHWLWGKGGYFDSSYRIPLIVRDPNATQHGRAGQRVTAFTENIDIAPTVLDWLGIEVPQIWDGRSLLGLAGGGEPDGWRDHVFWEYDFRDIEKRGAESRLGLQPDQCTLNVYRDERYKYVHFTALPPLLFDLENDPDEFENIADRPEAAAIIADYAGRLLSHRMLHAERTLTNSKLTESGVLHHTGPRS